MFSEIILRQDCNNEESREFTSRVFLRSKLLWVPDRVSVVQSEGSYVGRVWTQAKAVYLSCRSLVQFESKCVEVDSRTGISLDHTPSRFKGDLFKITNI